MVNFTYFHGLLQRAIIHESALPGFFLMIPVIHPESSGSALNWSRKPIMSGDPMVAVAVRILVSLLWSRSDAT